MSKSNKKENFKSPKSKLVKFFQTSRDKWKSKYKKIKYRSKLLSDQIRYWKKKNIELKQRIKYLEKIISESREKETEKKSP